MGKVEYPALLADGFHQTTVEQLREMCVVPFALSKTRARLMGVLEGAIERIRECRIQAELWIDGSFLTEKIDPSDVDVALLVGFHVRTGASPFVCDTLKWLESDDTNDRERLDGYVLTIHPITSPMVAKWDAECAHFTKRFGTMYDDKTPKGIAVIRFRGGS